MKTTKWMLPGLPVLALSFAALGLTGCKHLAGHRQTGQAQALLPTGRCEAK